MPLKFQKEPIKALGNGTWHCRECNCMLLTKAARALHIQTKHLGLVSARKNRNCCIPMAAKSLRSLMTIREYYSDGEFDRAYRGAPRLHEPVELVPLSADGSDIDDRRH
jgi:hypothetical protein